MQSLAERIADLDTDQRASVLAGMSDAEAEALLYDWRGFWARPEQIAPDGDWSTWLILAGRGFGKTRTGAEWVREQVAGGARRIALIAETAADARDVMVEGDSGILSVYPPGEAPLYEPSKRRITWPNGAVATLYNATEPDQLRGPQHEAAWGDELAKWQYATEAWDQLQFGLRLGAHPRVCITTTPRPIPLIRSMVAQSMKEGSGVVVTRGVTTDNRANLAKSFFENVVQRYEGTRKGRQELNAEILDDAPGALWTRAVMDEARITAVPEDIQRIVVAVDPAANDGRKSEEEDVGENGIVICGITSQKRGIVLEDATLEGSPQQWARRAVAMVDKWGADAIVAEINQGGAMVKSTIHAVRPRQHVIEVRATRGKHVRAEPISALYEQGRVSHVGQMPLLEDQMMLMTASGYLGDGSPDRLDALVWAMTELFPDIAMGPPQEEWDPLEGQRGGRPGSWMAG